MKNKTSILLLFLTFLFVNVGNATAQQKHEYVDLGLPSGTLWATCNVGAANPWDSGDYFAWGETESKVIYSWNNYKHGNGSHKDVSKKYNKTDNRAILEKTDDVAYQKWGSDWCMPTQAQFEELEDKCTWIWTLRNGKNGYEIKGPNGNIVFLPAAGWKGDDRNVSYAGSAGGYWTSSLDLDHPYGAIPFHFASNFVSSDKWNYRFGGLSVRPVQCRNNATLQSQSTGYNVISQSQSTEIQYVNLGLPTGTLWATCNIGASNPWDCGDYFAWGETSIKHAYSWSNYKYGDGSESKLTKYCNMSYCGNNGYTDRRTVLEPSDDVAFQKCGSDWCMPTQEQFQELYDNCTNEWTTNYQGKGVSGIIFKSKKNGNSIFFPAAGSKGSDGITTDAGSAGHYWSSALGADYPGDSQDFYFSSDDVDPGDLFYRCFGLPVRAVRCRNNATSQSQYKSSGHQYVNLGLPSGALWATTNVGASNPEDYGDYFAWGETSIKDTYSWSNYKYGDGSDCKLTKYSNKSYCGDNDYTDSRTTLEKTDDVAYLKWGSDWCMPTKKQFMELYDNCAYEWVTNYHGKGVAGSIFKSKKNGNTIFFPAAGCKGSDGITSDAGSDGFYWSSSLGTDHPCDAHDLYFNSDDADPGDWVYRSLGLPVRPVRCKN